MVANASWAMPTFRGNPFVPVSAIAVNDGILLCPGDNVPTPQTSGTTPWFFMASADNITATGSDWPYQELEFRWTLERSVNGDGTGGWEAVPDNEGLTNAATGADFNPYTDQIGPLACFVLRDSQLVDSDETVFRLTLDIRGATGYDSATGEPTGFVTASDSTTVTAIPFSGTTYYFDPVSGDDGGAGTELSPYQTWTKLLTLRANNTRFLLKSGTTMNVGAVFGLDHQLVRFDIYGGTARATLNLTSAVTQLFNMYSVASAENYVLSNLRVDLNNNATAVVYLHDGTFSDYPYVKKQFAVDNCYFTNNTGSRSNSYILWFGSYRHCVPCVVWNTTTEQTVVPTNRNANIYHTPHAGAHWMAIYDGETIGSGTASFSVLDHHHYLMCRSHVLIRCHAYGDCANGNRNYAAKIAHGVGEAIGTNAMQTVPRKLLIADCDLKGKKLGGLDKTFNIGVHNASAAQDPSAIGVWTDVVCEGNAHRGFDGQADVGGTYGYAVGDVRNNVFYGGISYAAFNRNASGGNWAEVLGIVSFHQNLIYAVWADAAGAATDARPLCEFDTTIERLIFAKNVFVDLRDNTPPGGGTKNTWVVAIASPEHPVAGGLVDFNQYYHPNKNDTLVWRDFSGSTDKTWAAWQALGYDANGIDGVDPEWINPSIGLFSESDPGGGPPVAYSIRPRARVRALLV